MRRTLTDEILTSTDRQEALSRAYVATIAAGAGYSLATQDFDRDGVDVQVRAGGVMLPSLDIQLKATTRLDRSKEEQLRYPLRRHNYDLLRQQTLVPRILVVLALPREERLWISTSIEELIIRHCANWADNKNYPETETEYSVTITLEKQNQFDIENLKDLMKRASKGTIS